MSVLGNPILIETNNIESSHIEKTDSEEIYILD